MVAILLSAGFRQDCQLIKEVFGDLFKHEETKVEQEKGAFLLDRPFRC